METPPPSPPFVAGEALRRTRPWFLATGALLALWMLLAVTLLILTIIHHGVATGQPFGPERLLHNRLFYLVAAYVATHVYVGSKLWKLAQAARRTDAAGGGEAAQAFAGFWRTNLRAHLLLWGFLAMLTGLAMLLRD